MKRPTQSRKVSKIRTVSTIHRTTRLEPPTEDTTNDAAPQPNVSDTADAIEEEQASSEPTSEPPIPLETVQPPVPARKKARMVWPRKSGLPGFGSYRGTKWYDFETEEQDEHDDPPLPVTTSNTRRSIPVTKYKDRHSEPEPTSGSKLPGHVRDDKPPGGDREYHGIGETEFDRRKRYREIKTFLSELPELPIHSEPGSNSKLPGTSKDDKSPGGDREQPGTGKMSQDPESPELPESEYHFDFRPDTSSEGSNPADHEPIPNEHNEGYPKFCINEFEDTKDYLGVYVRYRIAGCRMKFKESDTGNELRYTQFPGIELHPVGVWTEDRNNIPPCEWTMSSKEYREWFYSVHPKPVDVRQATRYWLDRREMLWRRQHPTPGSYEEFLQIKRWIGPGTKYEDGYDYIAHQEDTEDNGSLYCMHMIRQQAAIDLQHSAEDDAYITEQQIHNCLIANHEPEEGEEECTQAMRQKMEAT